MRIRWPMAGNCENPHLTEVYARPSPEPGYSHVIVQRGSEHSLVVELHTRCRRCKNCLRQRQLLWRSRAEWETLNAPRTWFGTLTLRPEEHYLATCRMSEYLTSRSVPLGELTDAQEWALLVRLIGREITLMLKRLRKRGMKFRYLVVSERHKSGAPHFHMLLHEVGDPVRYRDLENAWPLGFSKWRLATGPEGARYLAKYLSKDASSRVRASEAYGSRAVNPLGVRS